MKKTALIIINFFLDIIDNVAGTLMDLCEYALRFWRNNVLRKFVFSIIGYIEDTSARLKGRIEAIGTVLIYRMQYESITKPMKDRYHDLKNNRSQHI